MKPKVKTEEEIDITVNTRRKNRKWPTDARLVHVDRTPCSTKCMKTHKDDSDDDTVVNKSVKATYGQKPLDGVPPKSKPTLPGDITPGTSTSTVEIHHDNVSTSETMEIGPNDDPLNGVPLKETDQCVAKDLDSQTESVSTESDQRKLHGVPENSKETRSGSVVMAIDVRDTATNSSLTDQNQQELEAVPCKPGIPSPPPNKEIAKSSANTLDMSVTNEEPILPAIEQTPPSPNSQNNVNIDINLQHELTPEAVTMSTGIIEDLNQFDNLLNLNDEFDTDLPLMGCTGNIERLGPDIDLEIAMDNARFLEEHPIQGTGKAAKIDKTSTRSVRKPTKSSSDKVRKDVSVNTNTTSGTRLSSPRGVIQITSHVLQKPTVEEKQGKKFKCEAVGCSFTGYSRGAISTHYANSDDQSHPPCYCDVCGKVYANPSALARHKYVHNQEKPYACADCDESFTFQSELTAHRMKHRTSNAFRCMFHKCGKEFKRMSELNSHVVVHSGIIHSCLKSDYTTNNPRQLRDHQRSHSDEKRYKCLYCDERFKYTSGRQRHTDKHH